MTTWKEIIDAKELFLKTMGTEPLPEWFRGVGVGFELMDNNYHLAVRVQKDEHMALAEDVIERMKYIGPFEIQSTGDIAAL